MKYFSKNLSQGFVALYSGKMIQYVGYGLVGLFVPIYLFINLGENIQYVFWFYLVGHLAYALFVPLGAQFLNKIGLRRSLRLSIFTLALYYLSLFFLPQNLAVFLALVMFFQLIGRTLYWTPFHVDLAKFTKKKDRGKSVSLIWATHSFLSIIMPVISGLLIARFDYGVVFIIAIIIFLTSYIPYMALPRTKEKFSWGYFETFKHFFSKKCRKLVLANMANGAENVVGIVIWPIFIWQVLKGNYFYVGAISSLIVLVTVVLQLVVGKYTDIFNKRKMLHWGSFFYATGWLAKVFVLSSFQIFIVGTYHSFTQIFKDTPFDTLNYELLADQGHFVDEYTVLKEIAVQLGKVIMLLFVILIAMNFGLNWTFALAAFASLFINFL